MMACRALRKTDEAAQHEKILNALLDSVAASGDGKTAETSYFAATTQEEYIFLALRLNVKPKGESLITNNGHFYDRLEVVDPKTNLTRYVWFNADVQMNPAGKASADVSATPASSAGPVEIASEKPPSPPASATTHYTPPDDGMWSRQMNIEVTRTPGADKDHVVVQFTVPDASARFVSPGDKALQFNLIKIYGSRMQWGSRTDIPSGILAWPTGDWKPGDRVTLEFDLPKQFTSAVDGWSLRFCVGTAARCLPSPNLLLDARTAPATLRPELGWIDTFDGKSRGVVQGITFISLPFGGGAVFSHDEDSRIEYNNLPREGTLEWWVLVRGGYHYGDYKLHALDSCAVLFSSDAGGGDMPWPGATKLTLCGNGDITLDMTQTKNVAPHQLLRAAGTAFRFDEWHSVGISFGSQGQAIELDGALMNQAVANRQSLGAAGTDRGPADIPTIGQTFSAYWQPHRYDGGFDGIVARFRASTNQRDWVLTRTPPPEELSSATKADSSSSGLKGRSEPADLFDENGVTVSSVETPNNLELTIRAPEPIFVSVEVDRDQNGQIDRLVDVAYRPQRDGVLCTEYLIDETHNTACGQFVSAAYLKDEKTEEGRTQYTLVLPKKELSFNRLSAKLSFVMWNSAQRQTTYFPAGRFQNTLAVSYRTNAAAEQSMPGAANLPPESDQPARPDAASAVASNSATGGETPGFGIGSDATLPVGVYKTGGNISNPILNMLRLRSIPSRRRKPGTRESWSLG